MVTASAVLPSGSCNWAGITGGLAALGMRVTNTATMVMTPTIITAVSPITSHFRSFSEGGRSSSSGVSFMAYTAASEDDEDFGAQNTLTVTIVEGAADRIDKALARSVPEEAALSRTRLMKMIAEGAILRAGEPVTDPKTKVEDGEEILLLLEPPASVETLAEDIPLDILYEDEDLIVVNKPVGMVVHPAPGTPRGTLVNALLHHCGDTLSGIGGERRPGIVHRIDKDTSGLLVVAKSDRAHHYLAKQFEKHTVNRHYLAVVHGLPSAADPRLRGVKGSSFEDGGIIKIQTLLARHKTDRQRQAVVWHDGRHAITRARVLEHFSDQAALVECWLETGRTHQIRVHMAHAGHGLLGDQTYGGKRKLSHKLVGQAAADMGNSFPRQALHAATLSFEHPVTGEWLEFSSDLPEDMALLVETLAAGAEAASA